ncbi:MAG TPA: hypothetical protein VGI39_06035 [Polyangiaceae bacterium]
MKLATRNALTIAAVMTVAATAGATVKHEGTWPASETPVSLDATNLRRDDAIKRLADAAGWSVVLKTAEEKSSDTLTLHLKNQPPSKILDLILSGGAYVAKRDGSIVSIEGGEADDDASKAADKAIPKAIASAIEAATASLDKANDKANDKEGDVPPLPPMPAVPPVPPIPPVPPVPPVPGVHAHAHHNKHDRTITGGHQTIAKGESVGDVTVFGGSCDVYGDVEGDLAVFGGSAHIHEGGEVHGDAVTLGGNVQVDDGATIDGDVTRIGGSFHSSDKAHIGGTSRDGKEGVTVSVSGDDDDDDDKSPSISSEPKTPVSHGRHLLEAVGATLTESSLLFVFGAVLLALATRRMDALKVEVASRPMKSFALGVVGALASLVALVVLCVTIIGIPLAIVGVLGAVVAIYGSITAVLTTLGQALLGHKTSNPYVHLAVGCLILFVGGSIPWFGGLLITAVVLTSIGALVATRAAGFVPPRTRVTPTDPYRSAAG